MGRTGLTGVSGFALERGSVFIGQYKPNNKTRLPDPNQRSSFVFLRSSPIKRILLEALQSFAETDPARQAGAAVELQHPRETWAAALLKSLHFCPVHGMCQGTAQHQHPCRSVQHPCSPVQHPCSSAQHPCSSARLQPRAEGTAGMESSLHAEVAVPLFQHQIS